MCEQVGRPIVLFKTQAGHFFRSKGFAGQIVLLPFVLSILRVRIEVIAGGLKHDILPPARKKWLG